MDDAARLASQPPIVTSLLYQRAHLAEYLQRVVRRLAIRLEPREHAEGDEADDEADHELLERCVDEENGEPDQTDLPHALEHLEPETF